MTPCPTDQPNRVRSCGPTSSTSAVAHLPQSLLQGAATGHDVKDFSNGGARQPTPGPVSSALAGFVEETAGQEPSRLGCPQPVRAHESSHQSATAHGTELALHDAGVRRSGVRVDYWSRIGQALAACRGPRLSFASSLFAKSHGPASRGTRAQDAATLANRACCKSPGGPVLRRCHAWARRPAAAWRVQLSFGSEGKPQANEPRHRFGCSFPSDAKENRTSGPVTNRVLQQAQYGGKLQCGWPKGAHGPQHSGIPVSHSR